MKEEKGVHRKDVMKSIKIRREDISFTKEELALKTPGIKYYSISEIMQDAKRVVERLREGKVYTGVYGIPRGGVTFGLAVARELGVSILDRPSENCLVVDDVVDSGETYYKYKEYDFACIHVKRTTPENIAKSVVWASEIEGWVIYPWEETDALEGRTDCVTRMLELIGEDPNREGLLETPARVVKSWGELYGGYNQKPEAILKTFSEGTCDEMVVLKQIEFYSMCEHHMLPFFGKISVGYIPDKAVVGISKLARLVEVFSRRLQIQERLTGQIADALIEHLKPKGVMVVCEAKHLCMVARGVGKQGYKRTLARN